MQLHEIPIEQLRAHPANSNVMPALLLTKLVEHIRETDQYPPVIVREVEGDAYQILDGHHRVAALRELAKPTARCVVWQADDQQALLLLATLNRLQGQDDAKKRSALLGQLSRAMEVKDLAAKLPERMEHLQKLLAIDRQPPSPRPPRPTREMPQAVHFFLLPDDRAKLERKLKAIGGQREHALMQLVDTHVADEAAGRDG